MFHIGRPRIDELASDTHRADALLKFDPKVCSVCGIFLLFPDFGCAAVEKVDGGIVRTDESIGRVFGNEVFDGLALFMELVECL